MSGSGEMLTQEQHDALAAELAEMEGPQRAAAVEAIRRRGDPRPAAAWFGSRVASQELWKSQGGLFPPPDVDLPGTSEPGPGGFIRRQGGLEDVLPFNRRQTDGRLLSGTDGNVQKLSGDDPASEDPLVVQNSEQAGHSDDGAERRANGGQLRRANGSLNRRRNGAHPARERQGCRVRDDVEVGGILPVLPSDHDDGRYWRRRQERWRREA